MDTDRKLYVIPAILILTFVAVFVVMTILLFGVNHAGIQDPDALARVRDLVDTAIVQLSVIVMLAFLSVLIMVVLVFWSLQSEHQYVLRMKAQFFSMITHELRSPITPLRAEVQMLLEGYNGKLTSKQRASLRVVLRNSDRLDALICDLIDATKLQSNHLHMEFSHTDLHKEMAEAIADMEHLLPEKNISIVLSMDALPQLEVDPGRIMQVVRNLIGNAKKFSPVKGTIAVDVKRCADEVRFSIKDQGPGISASQQAHVFEPFFQGAPDVSKQYGGTGLGLVICRGIVKAHGGKMWFESEQGKGTTFFFTVPLRGIHAAA